jgi:glycosyltransferase involved in cell wall biosynthesis/SAM-dependent methyltransferase
MGEPVTVSIVIPVYNAERVLGETIRSALGQTWKDLEVVVVDDGSTDRSAGVVKSFGDLVRYYHFENGGGAKARNRGIALACGRYIALLDHDDLWAPTKLERQVAILEAHPEVGLVITDIEHIDRDGRPMGIFAQGYNPSDQFYRLFVKGYVPTPSSAMIRRSVIERAQGLDERYKSAGLDDQEFWTRVAACCEIANIAEPLTFHRNNEAKPRRIEIEHRALLIQTLLARFGGDPQKRRYLLREQAAYLLVMGKQCIQEGDRSGGQGYLREALRLCLGEAWSWKTVWRSLNRIVRSYVWPLRGTQTQGQAETPDPETMKQAGMEYVACELCGSGRVRVSFQQRDLTHGVSKEEFTVMKCTECGLLYLNPRPTRAEIGRYYPPQYFATPSPPRKFSRVKRWLMEDFYGYPAVERLVVWRSLRKALLWPEKIRRVFTGREILQWVGKGRLLDVGCGHGVSAAILQKQGWEVCGLDLNEVAIECARMLLGSRAQLGDLMSARYPAGSFDVVLFSHSLEHMYNPLGALQEAKRILADDGRLIVRLPNAGSWEAKFFGRWWFPWELPRHLYHFERSTLTGLVERAGFFVIQCRTGVTSAYFMTSLERVWQHRLGRKLPASRLVERLIARPFCLIAGNVGYGTEITVHAVKAKGVTG